MECNGIPCRESVETLSVEPEHLAAFTLPEEALDFQPEGEDVYVRLSSGVLERRVHSTRLLREEEIALQKLRLEARRSGKRFSPEICSEATRYLSATRQNHEKALSLMEATEQWRRQYFKDGPLRSADVLEDMSHGFAYFVGRDRALRPALVFRASRVPEQWRKDFDIDRLLRVLIFCMEVLLRFMLVPGKVETSCLIVDLQDISTKDIPVSLLREIHQLFTAHYPCRGFRFYVCNVPRMLMAISHVAKGLLTERQRLKVQVLSDVRELLEEFAPHQLEQDLGGSKPVATSFLPFPLGPGPFYPGSKANLSPVVNLHQASLEEAREELERRKAEASGLSPSSEETRQGTVSGRLTSSPSPESFEAQPWAFREGDDVDVWSVTRNCWVPGVVQAFYRQSAVADGFAVPAGALKISIPGGCKWIPPELIPSNVRRVAPMDQCREIAKQGRVLLSASLVEEADHRCGSPGSEISDRCMRRTWFCL